MTTELTQKLENIISGHSINEDDADWLRALTAAQPAQAGEADTGPRVLREVFALCEDTMTKMESVRTEFSRGRAFEAKGISRAIGTWFQDEFCGRSHMGEPVTQPAAQATPEPVLADSSEHLRVIASLGAALRRLSFAAQTSGGTAGPDAELQAAIGQAEQVLSFGGIAQAMFATPPQQAAGEPVEIVDLPRGYPVIGKLGDICSIRANDVRRGDILYTHPAPGVPEIDYSALIHAAWGKHKYAQGTGGCIAFKRGAEWFRDIALAAAQAKGGE